MSLGAEGYGLLGLIAGLMVFVSFFNKLLGKAVGRFYAYSIGLEASSGNNAEDECRHWFNTALLIHTVVPCVLLMVGYPVGVYVVEHILVVPVQYSTDAIWLLRFTCIATFIGMITVPQNAMYMAKQYIAELTVYSLATTMLNVLILYWMVTHNGRWLVWLSGIYCLEQIVVPLILAIRAHIVFPECRIVPSYLFDFKRLKKVFVFAGWQAIGMVTSITKTQGEAVLVNRFFGTKMNASISVATSLSGRLLTFSNEIQAAFQPAIVTAYGAGNLAYLRSLSHKCDKFCSLMMLFFAVPVCVEIDLLLKLWLKNPPLSTASLCYAVVILQVVDKSSVGEEEVIQATGRQGLLKIINAVTFIGIVPVVWICFRMGLGIGSIVNVNLLFGGLFAFARVLIARREVNFSIHQWLKGVFMPICTIALAGIVCSLPSRCFLPESYWRLAVTGVSGCVPMLWATWMFLLSKDEREIIGNKVLGRLSILRGIRI